MDGKLFEERVDTDKVHVRERSHFQLRTFHREDVYIIDIVTRDHFQRFFEAVSEFHAELVRCIASLCLPAEFREAARAKSEKLLG